jgi:SulP family sulfate permease
MKEVDAPDEVGANEVIILQPYGSLFFASAPVFDEALPDVVATSHNSVAIIRLRGRSDLGATFMDVLSRYATALRAADCKLMVIYNDDKVSAQLLATGTSVVVGAENIYESDEWLGQTLRRANDDAVAWIASNGPVT